MNHEELEKWLSEEERNKIENYDLDGVQFFEMHMIANDPVVFAFDESPSAKEPHMFLRAMNYYLHTQKGVGITGWRWLEHGRECEKWRDSNGDYYGPATPDEFENRPCKCLQRNFDRCQKGSLNARRKRSL